MTHKLVFDTETSGLPLWNDPSEDPRQPHIVQLAAALVDMDTRETVASMDVIVRPRDWTIPDEVASVHGITTEKAMDLGIPEELAVAIFLDLWRGRTVIAHNVSFDQRILRIALKRFPQAFAAGMEDQWKAGACECTAKLATPIVKCPPHRKDAPRRSQPLQEGQPDRGIHPLLRQAVRRRTQRYGGRRGVSGRLLCDPRPC